MYILTFKRSRSKYFEKGLNLALKLGGTWDGQQMMMSIPDDMLFYAYEHLMPLFGIVQNWSSTRATFNDRDVHPFQFILSMNFLKECSRNSDRNPQKCWITSNMAGWSCKKLTNISYWELGNGKYKRNDRYWYNFGKFDSKNEWRIDKIKIYEKLIEFSEIKGLYICPHFCEKKVKDAVYSLPSKIIPDNKSYRVHFTDFFNKGEKLKFPENIRHISHRPQDLDTQSRMEYDPSKIRPIIHPGSEENSEKGQSSEDIYSTTYHLRVYNNFQYMDESKAYNYGTYTTYDEAERAAKRIIIEFFKHNWSKGISPESLLAQYGLYGEAPVILPSDNPTGKTFSASDFASENAEPFCKKHESD